jgi:hypothetical protein
MARYRSSVVFFLSVFLIIGPQCWADNWRVPAHTWGGANFDGGNAVALDSAGNVYVAGLTQSFGAGGEDILITKYGPKGQFLWAKTWGGGGDEWATSIKVGPDGYLYVSGYTSSFGAGWCDLLLLKLDENGNLVWGTTWGGGSYDGADDIAFDTTGNVYVVGESYSTSPCCSAVLLKFSPSGALLNQVAYKGPATYDSGYSLTVDSNSNVIVAGISWDYTYSPVHNSILLLKYDPTGNLLWQENWSTPFPGQDESWAFHALTTDKAGNIYVGGRHSNDCTNPDFSQCDFDALLLKLSANGGFLWARTSGNVGTYDTAASIALDTEGHVIFSGTNNGIITPQLFVKRLDTSGNLLSQMVWNGGTLQSPKVGMTATPAGELFVAGSALNNSGNWSAASGTSGTLSNSMIVNSYSAFSAAQGTALLTPPTAIQTGGIKETGGGEGDLFIAHHFANSLAPLHHPCSLPEVQQAEPCVGASLGDPTSPGKLALPVQK